MAVARHGSPFEPSPSPQPQPLTKRDVRRNRIMERLQTMMDSFSTNQHQHYRAQLQAVQVDMTLVLRADPYANGPLDDTGEDIRALVESMGATPLGDEAAQKDYQALAGSRYREYVRQVNDAIEQRDADLTDLHNNYHASVAELERNTRQKLHQAEEEHKALSNTIRQRLVTSITKKRQQLLRDKEQLDIADSNALLLHPHHFSINNPGSPSNGQNRKTRHLRHRATSPGEAGENGKRKRKAAAIEDDGNESPVPAFSLPPPDALGGGKSPFKDARDKTAYTQYEAPAYSLERLFTDKELAMASATAQQATYRHFHQSPEQGINSNGNGTGDGSLDEDAMETGENDDAAPTTEGGVNGTPPPSQPAAPEMERTTSHQVLTRGGARANPLAALSDLAMVAAASAPALRTNPFAPVAPTYQAVSRVEKSGAPAPPAVNPLDTENDFEMMRRAGDLDDGDDDNIMAYDGQESAGREMRRQLLDQALGNPTVTQPYRLPLLEVGPALVPRGVDRLLQTGFAPAAVPTAIEQRVRANVAANALAGLSGGSMAAALQSRVGGESMSRTTSAGGVSEAGESGPVRRGRGRLV